MHKFCTPFFLFLSSGLPLRSPLRRLGTQGEWHHLRSGMARARSTGTAVTLFWGEPSMSFSE